MWDGCTVMGNGPGAHSSSEGLAYVSPKRDRPGFCKGLSSLSGMSQASQVDESREARRTRGQSSVSLGEKSGSPTASAFEASPVQIQLLQATMDFSLRPQAAKAAPPSELPWSSSSPAATVVPQLQANGQAPPVSVKELLQQAGERHESELGVLREELLLLCRENERLRLLLPGERTDEGDALTPQGVVVSVSSEKGLSATPPPQRTDVLSKFAGGELRGTGSGLTLYTSHFDGKDNFQIKLQAAGGSASSEEKKVDPVTDSKKFKIKALWEKDPKVTGSRPLDNFSFMGDGARFIEGKVERRKDHFSENFPQDKGCVISPDSSWRLLWDLMGLTLICYDLLTIPLVQCFSDSSVITDATEHGLFYWMDWVTLVFWTGDMAQGFFLGYWQNGMPVTDKKAIFKNYMRTWFMVDILVVAPEWLLIFAKSMMQDAGAGGIGLLGKILKSARAIRVLRLVRLVKLQRIVNKCYDMISDEQTFIAVNLFKLLVAILALNHVIACCWYGLGRLGRGDADWFPRELDNWIDVQQLGDGTMGYRYTTSLHWSLTQFTPASMQVSATNVGERIFSIIVLFFAMVCFSSIVGSITGSMTQLRSLKNDDAKQFWLLRRYMKQQHVDKPLVQRIIKHLEYQVSQKSNQVQSAQLKILSELSPDLTRELEHDLTHVHWAEHPFFRLMDKQTTVILHLIDHNIAGKKCLYTQWCSEEERIFRTGDEAKFMLFICFRPRSRQMIKMGEVTATKDDEDQPPSEVYFEYKVGTLSEGENGKKLSRSQSQVTQRDGQSKRRMTLCSGEWVSEAVIWTADWRHMGELVCCYVCEILTVDPELFYKVVQSHPRSWFLAKKYAGMFVNWINGEDPKHPCDPGSVTDVIRSGKAWLDSEAHWYKDTGEELEYELQDLVEKARKATEEAKDEPFFGSEGSAQDVPNGHEGGKHVDVYDHQLTGSGTEKAQNSLAFEGKGPGARPPATRPTFGDQARKSLVEEKGPGAEVFGARARAQAQARPVREAQSARGEPSPGRRCLPAPAVAAGPACEAFAGTSPAQRGPRRALASLCGGR